MKQVALSFIATLFAFCLFAQDEETNDSQTTISYEEYVEEIDAQFEFQEGFIELPSGNADLNVPEGFQFLDQEQANYVLSDLWGNPEDDTILGLLVPVNRSVMDDNGWVFVISFEEMGYVKDDDAGDIDYDDLLEELQQDSKEDNKWRSENGYEPVDLVGWASSPYYDENKKVLHWAKELEFEGDSVNTLNYNLRVLGRKGVFILNAVASMNELPEVKTNINSVINSVTFKEGHRYMDFDENIDDVAAWTIGGLVAGKILAKAGFFVFLAKFWKIIAIAIAGAGGGFMKFFRKKKKTPAISEKTDEV
ncbi:MAG: putative membrane-anchored protein [Flavobacteriales bacterium]|jgi:uncharacterized membrane-anchored protein